MIKVVAALIKIDNKYLIAKRSTGNSESLGKWEFPGGKVESDESEEEAIIREIKEELFIDIKVNKFLDNVICQIPNRVIDLRLYDCDYVSGSVKLCDHSEYKLVELEDILNYDLTNPDRILANNLLHNS